MNFTRLNCIAFILANACLFFGTAFSVSAQDAPPFRLGIIGTNTSHVPAFVELFNNPKAGGAYARYEIVGAYKGGMPDNDSSWGRTNKIASEIEAKGVKIYPTIEELLKNVDGVLLEEVDARPHLEYASQVIAAKKPMFIDKPAAGCLEDVLAIYNMAQEQNVPIFSASTLRYSSSLVEAQSGKWGAIQHVEAWSPHHPAPGVPELYFYGIHAVDPLFALMGSGCVSVSRTSSPSCECVVGVWKDGRIGIARAIARDKSNYGFFLYGSKGDVVSGKYDGYKLLGDALCRFFDTGKPDFDSAETIEIFAFMTAADQSKALNSQTVLIADTIQQAKNREVKTFRLIIKADKTLTLNGEAVTPDQATKTFNSKTENQLYRVVVSKDAAVEQSYVNEEILPLLKNVYFAGYYESL